MELNFWYTTFAKFSLCLLGFLSTDIFAVEPSFDVPVVNITVVAGKTAILPCSVEHLGDHKVVWTDQLSTLLTFGAKRIIDDERMGIDRPRTRDWNLILHDVAYADRGRYTCQINTHPIKTKTVELYVAVPPKIQNTPNQHVITKEGETVTLTCNVTGVPPPVVTWYKSPLTTGTGDTKQKLETYIHQHHHHSNNPPSESCTYTIRQTEVGMNGEILIIHNVSRYCEGIYECVAFNDVPPAVNKEIRVLVEFAPEIRLPNKRIGQEVGKETILECEITAFPQAVSVWKFDAYNLRTSRKHRIDVYNDGNRQITLSLRVTNITKEDFGMYTCYADNKLGRDQETMILFDSAPIRTTTTTKATTSSDPYEDNIEYGEQYYFPGYNENDRYPPNGYDPGNNPIVPDQIVPDSAPTNGIVCSGGIIYICTSSDISEIWACLSAPAAGRSSMGNRAGCSASPKMLMTVLIIMTIRIIFFS